MAVLTVRNLEDDVVRRLRIRAAEHGRSAEAEHREILRAVLVEEEQRAADRRRAVTRAAEFRERTGGTGSPSTVDLIEEGRAERTHRLVGEAVER